MTFMNSTVFLRRQQRWVFLTRWSSVATLWH